MKTIAKIQINLFNSDTYRAMLAKYGAPGALLIVRLQVLEQAGTLPDFTDERQMLILATEIGSDASIVTEMIATLQDWTHRDTIKSEHADEPCVPTAIDESTPQNPKKQKNLKNLNAPKNPNPTKKIRRKSARKSRRAVRQTLNSLAKGTHTQRIPPEKVIIRNDRS